MHLNAEIGYLTQQYQTLFIQMSREDYGFMNQSTLLKSTTPAEINQMDVTAKVLEKTPDQIACFLDTKEWIFYQVNIQVHLKILNQVQLVHQILLISQLQFDKVPASWEKFAYFSIKGLAAWFNNLIKVVSIIIYFYLNIKLKETFSQNSINLFQKQKLVQI
ncbi:unnamed protein product [Paramecium sonneborni]|uniref:Transmembrane protein n=1 Tax=Paramecium sonneborni TaxID=65129 RepID=A0A8S1QAJ7_9CILI|nr:unnamed protein product [Paramecium sonneborni]